MTMPPRVSWHPQRPGRKGQVGARWERTGQISSAVAVATEDAEERPLPLRTLFVDGYQHPGELDERMNYIYYPLSLCTYILAQAPVHDCLVLTASLTAYPTAHSQNVLPCADRHTLISFFSVVVFCF